MPAPPNMRCAVASRICAISRPAARTASSTSGGAVWGLPLAKGGSGAYCMASWICWARRSPRHRETRRRAPSMPAVTPAALTCLPSTNAFVRGYRAEVFQKMKGGPMRVGAYPLQQPGGPAEQGSGADREDVCGVRRLGANERENRLIVHQLLLSPAAGHYQHVQLGRFGERHLRRQNQAFDVSHGGLVFPEHVKPGVGNARQHFEWTGEVHLIHAGKDDGADLDRIHITKGTAWPGLHRGPASCRMAAMWRTLGVRHRSPQASRWLRKSQLWKTKRS